MDPGDDRETLAERVEQLEATVEQQQSTIRKMLPGRRGVIKGVGAAIGGGLLGASATGGASGQSGPAGRQGTPENPNDMFAWDLDVANEVVTDLRMGGNDITDAGSLSAGALPNIADHIVDPTDGDLASVISEAAAGDVIWLGKGKHTVNGTVTIDKPLSIVSEHHDLTGDQDDASDKGIDEIDGAVIEQQQAGAHVLKTLVNAEAVNLKNIALTWESSIRDSDTGHGVLADAPDDPNNTGNKLNGLFYATWENVAVVGQDGDSYAFEIHNPQHLQLTSTKSWGGGGLHWVQNTGKSINYGNSVVENFYHEVNNDGTAHGIYHETAGGGTLNLITYVRPQVNWAVGTSSGGQQHFKKTSNTQSMTWLGVNFEAGGAYGGIDAPASGSDWLPSFISGDIPGEGATAAATFQNGIRRPLLEKRKFGIWLQLLDSSGGTGNFIEEAGTDGIIINALNDAAGAQAGLIRVRSDTLELQESDGTTRIEYTEGGSIGFYDTNGNKIGQLLNSGDLDIAGTLSESVTF